MGLSCTRRATSSWVGCLVLHLKEEELNWVWQLASHQQICTNTEHKPNRCSIFCVKIFIDLGALVFIVDDRRGFDTSSGTSVFVILFIYLSACAYRLETPSWKALTKKFRNFEWLQTNYLDSDHDDEYVWWKTNDKMLQRCRQKSD